jgi:hypothetical protein
MSTGLDKVKAEWQRLRCDAYRRLRVRRECERVRRDRILGYSVDLSHEIKGWYEFREGYPCDYSITDDLQRRCEVQDKFRDLFTYQDCLGNARWSDWWRYPLELAKRYMQLLAFMGDKTPREVWDEIRKGSSYAFGEENTVRASVLARRIVEDCGEISFPTEF